MIDSGNFAVLKNNINSFENDTQARCEDAIKNGISYITDDYGSQKITVAGNGSESVPRFISKCKSESLKICSDQSEEVVDYELAH